jgi:hypothetical protein
LRSPAGIRSTRVPRISSRSASTWPSAGGIIHATAVEVHHETSAQATARVRGIADTLTGILDTAHTTGSTPAATARRRAEQRIRQGHRHPAVLARRLAMRHQRSQDAEPAEHLCRPSGCRRRVVTEDEAPRGGSPRAPTSADRLHRVRPSMGPLFRTRPY